MASVKGLVKGAVARTQDEIRAADDLHSPAAPLRYRKNMVESVVAPDHHEVRRNALPWFVENYGAVPHLTRHDEGPGLRAVWTVTERHNQFIKA